MEAVRIAGVGMTSFDAYPTRTGRDLFAEAASEAIEDAAVPREDVEEVIYGNFMGEVAERQGHQGPLVADAAGVDGPATRVESACASGGAAVREGVKTIRSGAADVVLVGGMERMTTLGTEAVTGALAMAADDLYERRAGLTFPGAYALIAQSYLDRHGGSREDLAAIAVKNHENAVPNEYAQHRRTVSIEDVLEAPVVANPIGLYDACPISDGAAAVVLMSDSYATERNLETKVSITGTGQAGDSLSLQERADVTATPATASAARRAYDQANVGPQDVDLAEVHDCFTIAEVLAIEGLGFYERGSGIDAAASGETRRDGRLPVNLSGGLKAKGHPVGATGVSQIVEVTRLLRGDHPNSEYLTDPAVGVTHNAGGTVASAVVHVLEVAA